MDEIKPTDVVLAPRIVRIIAGIDFVLMFAFAITGAIISLIPVNNFSLILYLDGQCLLLQERRAEAQVVLKEAREALRPALGEEHPRVVQIEKWLREADGVR